jgi:DNA-binding NarL/FixJ family response regulator
MHIPNSSFSPDPRPLRLLIVDDMPQVRQELHLLLDLSEEVNVVGEAINGLDAIRQVSTLHPDVVVMDLEMPGMDGCQATGQIKAMDKPPKVIILTVHSGLEIEQRVQQSGADLLIQKGASLEKLMTAILNL